MSFQLQFFGATEQVTGSLYVIRVAGHTVLLECGLIQGGRKEEKRNHDPFPVPVGEIDAVIRSHLKNNIWRPECHLVIVGYQAHGTLGRRLVDGVEEIKLWGNTYKVRAQIHTIGGLSAHADQTNLPDWYAAFRGQATGPPGVWRRPCAAGAREKTKNAAKRFCFDRWLRTNDRDLITGRK